MGAPSFFIYVSIRYHTIQLLCKLLPQQLGGSEALPQAMAEFLL